jgi:hypothetical protein
MDIGINVIREQVLETEGLFVPMQEKGRIGRGKLHNKELHNLNPLLSIVSISK